MRTPSRLLSWDSFWEMPQRCHRASTDEDEEVEDKDKGTGEAEKEGASSDDGIIWELWGGRCYCGCFYWTILPETVLKLKRQ